MVSTTEKKCFIFTSLRILGLEMSHSDLLELFTGQLDAQECVRYVLALKSPQMMKKFLIRRHEILFPEGDRKKNQKWGRYSRNQATSQLRPLTSEDLSDADFLIKIANKLSFDISRFTEFLSGYNTVDEDIKPIMFHYALIYIFDFFSRTWLKYGHNPHHALSIIPNIEKTTEAGIEVKVHSNGVFPRAVDAFYLLGQSSLLSCDDETGISYQPDLNGNVIPKRIQKQRYSDEPRLNLSNLIGIYDNLNRVYGYVKISNQILVGYMIVFVMSSVCRYLPEQWFNIQEDRDLKSKLEILQSDYLHQWIPEILLQIELERDILGLDFESPSLETRFGFDS